MDCNPAYQRVLSPQFSPHCGCWEFEPAVGVSLSKAIGGSSTHWSSICHEFPSVQILYPYTSLGERCNVQCSGESAPLFNGAGPITKCVGGAPKVVVPSSRLFCLEKGRGNPSIGIQWTWPSGKHTKSYGKSPFFMGKSTISMAMLNSYVSLPEGKWDFGVFRCFFSASSVLTAGFNVSHGQSTKKSCFASRRPCYRSVGCLIY